MHWPYNGFWTARYRISQRSSLDSVADISLPHIIWSDQTFRQSSTSSSSSSSDYPRLERGVSLLFTWSFINKAHIEEHFSYYIVSVAGNGHHVIGPQFGSLLWYFIMRANNLSFCGQFFFILKNVEKLLVTIKNYFARGGPPSKKPLRQKCLR